MYVLNSGPQHLVVYAFSVIRFSQYENIIETITNSKTITNYKCRQDWHEDKGTVHKIIMRPLSYEYCLFRPWIFLANSLDSGLKYQ